MANLRWKIFLKLKSLIKLISKLPGLGPKSARRIILKLINNKEDLHKPMVNSMANVFKNIIRCNKCGSIKSINSACQNCEKKKIINQTKFVLLKQFLINGQLKIQMYLMVIFIF